MIGLLRLLGMALGAAAVQAASYLDGGEVGLFTGFLFAVSLIGLFAA
jgi:hypothetical protein